LTVVTKTLPGEIHVTNVHKKDLKALEVVMKEAEEVVEALEVVAEEAVEVVLAVAEVVTVEAEVVDSEVVTVTAEAVAEALEVVVTVMVVGVEVVLEEAVVEAVQCVEAAEVAAETDIVLTKPIFLDCPQDQISQEFKSRKPKPLLLKTNFKLPHPIQ